MKTIKIGLVQQAITPNIEANKAKLANNVRDLARQGAQLVVLQELHNSLYFCQTEDTNLFDLAEPIPGHPPSITASWRPKQVWYW
jgi:N-carbamoylputrescine amidase